MLRAIELRNFKCFESQRIELGATTLLAGVNGMGKSSVLQSLLILQQSDAFTDWLRNGLEYERDFQGPPRDDEGNFVESWEDELAIKTSPPVVLNGRYVSTGTTSDLLYERADSDKIGLKFEWDGSFVPWIAFEFDAAGAGRDALRPTHVRYNHYTLGVPFSKSASYLSADRIGPRVAHSVSAYHVEVLDSVGSSGAYAVDYLERRSGTHVAAALHHPAAADDTLAGETRAWMTEICPGLRLHTRSINEISAASLEISFASGGASTRPFRPTGVGFGISYILPVVVNILSAPKGGLVLIENPEAHLHPRGQMAIGGLIARAGLAGVQIIAETHSDHVLNGVRLAIKDLKIPPATVKVNFFARRDDGDRLVHHVESPRIDADGRFDVWPDGFFDQWDIALDRLV